jgi:hypothetical protein
MTDTADRAQVPLSQDEAIVLFELLSRWFEDDDAARPGVDSFESPAECAVLAGVLASLEKQLVAPFRDDYAKTVEAARERLAEGWDGTALRV